MIGALRKLFLSRPLVLVSDEPACRQTGMQWFGDFASFNRHHNTLYKNKKASADQRRLL